ncbi:MAG: hypothetical protein ABL998_13930 [Planctomycetota bacterium]
MRFYSERNVPFDANLYSVGPSRLEANAIWGAWLPKFSKREKVSSPAGLPGLVESRSGSGFFFPAAKFGEAWEWIFGPTGQRVSWSRRLLKPEGEGSGHPKSKCPTGSRHQVHHVPGWAGLALKRGELLITEGVRKANEVQRRTGIAALGLPSVAASRQTIDEVQLAMGTVRPRRLLLAPDYGDLVDGAARHDATREQVLLWRAFVDMAEEQGIEVGALAWSTMLGKGIDDALSSLDAEPL